MDTESADKSIGAVQDTLTAPGPEGVLAYDTSGSPLKFTGDLFHTHGDVVRYGTRFGSCFLFSRPEHVQTVLRSENYRRNSLFRVILGDGLLSSNGPHWRSQRRLMHSDFAPRRIAALTSMMVRETERTAMQFRAASSSGTEIDVFDAMTQLTLRIVIAALFSDALEEQEEKDLCIAITKAMDDLTKISWMVFGTPVQFTPARNAEFSSARSIIEGVCLSMMERRRRMPPDQRPQDLLTTLIESATEDDPKEDRRIRDEMVTMLIAGHETTALALTWTWKTLSEHPEAEAKLHEEVDRVVNKGTAEATAFTALPWTRAIFQETMRLYPPVWIISRVAVAEGVVHGYSIPKGASVLLPIWFMHRHAGFWSEPEKFMPERFLPDRSYDRDAYLPFGGGRHTCLGMHFAMLEGTLVLASLARDYRLRPTNGPAVEPLPGITLRQAPNMLAVVEAREGIHVQR